MIKIVLSRKKIQKWNKRTLFVNNFIVAKINTIVDEKRTINDPAC